MRVDEYAIPKWQGLNTMAFIKHFSDFYGSAAAG